MRTWFSRDVSVPPHTGVPKGLAVLDEVAWDRVRGLGWGCVDRGLVLSSSIRLQDLHVLHGSECGCGI